MGMNNSKSNIYYYVCTPFKYNCQSNHPLMIVHDLIDDIRRMMFESRYVGLPCLRQHRCYQENYDCVLVCRDIVFETAQMVSGE